MGKLLSLDARGKFGYSGGFGRIAFGYTRLGWYSWYCGIYSKHYYYGKPFISRMKFYLPKNNQMEQQQLWRGVLASAVLAWKALDSETKISWNKRVQGRCMSGYNLFISEYLKSHKL